MYTIYHENQSFTISTVKDLKRVPIAALVETHNDLTGKTITRAEVRAEVEAAIAELILEGDVDVETSIQCKDDFFDFARERHNIWARRFYKKQPAPWTDDPILKKCHFTNIYRELDKTTIWFRETIRDYFKYSPNCVFATIAFRRFNSIETARRIIDKLGLEAFTVEGFFPEEWDRVLREHPPWCGVAYNKKLPAGYDELAGTLWCIDQAKGYQKEFFDAKLKHGGFLSLETACKLLVPYPLMGPAMAYEVSLDLQHTRALDNAPDRNTWANPGTDVRRGLSRILGKDIKYFTRNNTDAIQELMQRLLVEAQLRENWDFLYSPPWGMSEVATALREWDKYEHIRLSKHKTKRRKYP